MKELGTWFIATVLLLALFCLCGAVMLFITFCNNGECINFL